jgi:hypothetical protein
VISAGEYYLPNRGGIDDYPYFDHDYARLSVDNPYSRAGPGVAGPDVYVTNIYPHGYPEPSGVEFILHVDSDRPIDVAVTITVFDPVERGLLVE